jgi:hypothetical protein
MEEVRVWTRSSHSELPGRHSHDPAKLFHPSRMVKQFSGWDEVILSAHETSQKQTPAINNPDCRNYLAAELTQKGLLSSQ